MTMLGEDAEERPSGSRYDVAKDQWGNVIRVQIHFNEAIHRTRQLTATAVLLIYGAALAYFASNSFKFLVVPWWGISIHFATPLVLLAFIFIIIGYILDRHYYFKMLEMAVIVAMDAERDFDLPIKLSTGLSQAVKPGWAKFTIALFYFSAAAVGGLIIWAVNVLTVFGAPG